MEHDECLVAALLNGTSAASKPFVRNSAPSNVCSYKCSRVRVKLVQNLLEQNRSCSIARNRQQSKIRLIPMRVTRICWSHFNDYRQFSSENYTENFTDYVLSIRNSESGKFGEECELQCTIFRERAAYRD